MTIRKQYPPRTYQGFPEEEASDGASHTPSSSDKSRSAAAEARRLASEGSWADNFAGETPATNRTPTASTVDDEESRGVQYPQLSHEIDPSDPPPMYTPSDTTPSQPPTGPASPVVHRALPAQPEIVSTPDTIAPSPIPPVQRAFRDDEDGVNLPEPVQYSYGTCRHERPDQNYDDTDSDNLPAFLGSSSRWGRGRRWWRRRHGEGRGRGCGGRRLGRRRENHKERARRCKKICWFTFALLLCLWLMIPGLCKSFSKDNRSRFPVFSPDPSSSPWPPVPKREHREHETSRSISGTYQLYDLLDLSTTSGSINVNIQVQSGDKPAVLRLATKSGSVHVRFSSGGGFFSKPVIPKISDQRPLMIDISTNTGSVSGDLVYGNGGSTTISTRSGSITLTMYSVGVSERDPVSNISTTTTTGSQTLKIMSPLASTEAVRAIQARHTVQGSGSMNIQYPQEWEGMVHIKVAGSGSVIASGRELNVQKESSRELYGYKGSKEGRTVDIFTSGSGSALFQC
ncbi:hypothetical protein PV08_05380 [Exophiala spinifera]|uniref:Adhesin domain-containing protein n=1 Tax=Exophiala spinifera TaxID=91928 RepID=A0A0D2BVL9_9EURO|nr:uncharacterized protein PV08_05380 [Exophiala spinifera]KIW15334.1 hypothetical protein PV08_05380 [Exophiala spinifera]